MRRPKSADKGVRSLGRLLRRVRHGLRVLGVDLLGLVPALMVGAGIALVSAGLINYTASTQNVPAPTDTIPPVSGPLPSFSFATPSLGSGAPTAVPTAPVAGIPTRIVIRALSIDLPIIASPAGEVFPFCNVAEIFALPGHTQEAVGLPQATYLAAHARTGMFLPLLTASQKNAGASMLGDSVEIYTADNQDHVYEISQVIPHVPVSSSAFDRATAAKTDQLWLQTSEGPLSSSPKLQVLALPIGIVAATYADSHPSGHGQVCPDAPRCKNSKQTGCRR